MEQYENDNCWFEVKSPFGRTVTRDHDSFTRTARALSRLECNIALYKIENGKKLRIFMGC